MDFEKMADQQNALSMGDSPKDYRLARLEEKDGDRILTSEKSANISFEFTKIGPKDFMQGVAPADVLDPRAAAFDGYSGVGDYAGANGNTWAVIQEGHSLRDRKFVSVRVSDVSAEETVDTVIVGGGISGLASALFLQRTAHPRQCLVLDDHPIFGGLAKSNEIIVDGERLVGNQASALFFPPLPGSFLAEFYPSIGIDRDIFDYQTWSGSGPELPVGRTCYLSGGRGSSFYFGRAFGRPEGTLVVDPIERQLEGAPLSDDVRREVLSTARETEVRAKWQPKAHDILCIHIWRTHSPEN